MFFLLPFSLLNNSCVFHRKLPWNSFSDRKKKILVFIYLKNIFFSVFSDCLRIRVRRWRSIFRRQWLIENNYVANSIIQWKFLKVQVDFGRKIDVNHSQLTERCSRDKKKLFVTVVQLWKKLRKITCYFTFLIIQFFFLFYSWISIQV